MGKHRFVRAYLHIKRPVDNTKYKHLIFGFNRLGLVNSGDLVHVHRNPREGTPILGIIGRFYSDDPHF